MDEGSPESATGSPAPEGALGSDGGSPLFCGAATGLSGREAGPVEPVTADGVGLLLSGSPVLAGGAAESLGRDAGLAASGVGVARSGTVVGSAGVGAGAGVGRAGGVGRSNAPGVNAIGGSKTAKVLKTKALLNTAVHNKAQVGSREKIFIGGTIKGSHLQISNQYSFFEAKKSGSE